jgi:hypothetical protein
MIRDDDFETTLDPELLAVLACPVCPQRPPLSVVGHYLVCAACHSAFPVLEGIPQLTPEDAVPVSQIKDETDD